MRRSRRGGSRPGIPSRDYGSLRLLTPMESALVVSNSMNAVDTNIFIYSVDRNEPAKQLKAQQQLTHLRSVSEPTILLWQVLGELVQQLRRWRDQGQITDVEFLQHVQAFRHLFPLVLPVPGVL